MITAWVLVRARPSQTGSANGVTRRCRLLGDGVFRVEAVGPVTAWSHVILPIMRGMRRFFSLKIHR
jgi:hypothetical protein